MEPVLSIVLGTQRNSLRVCQVNVIETGQNTNYILTIRKGPRRLLKHRVNREKARIQELEEGPVSNGSILHSTPSLIL